MVLKQYLCTQEEGDRLQTGALVGQEDVLAHLLACHAEKDAIALKQRILCLCLRDSPMSLSARARAGGCSSTIKMTRNF